MRWILQKLLGLDPKVLDPNATLTLRFAQSWPLWILVLAAIGIALYVAFIYRKEGRPVGGAMRSFLTALRVLALVLLVGLLCEPILLVEEAELTRPYVAFMIDTSQSMDLHDRFPEKEDQDRARQALPEEYRLLDKARADLEQADLQKLSRLDFVNEVLKGSKTNPAGTGLAKRYHIRYYEFAEKRYPRYSEAEKLGVPPGEVRAGESTSMGSEGTETRIGDCMRAVLNDLRGQSVAGVVLLSDGRNNAGASPLDAARIAAKRDIPIYAVGVGDRKIFDLEVKRLEAPERVRKDDAVSFLATLSQKGYAGEQVTVVLKRGGEKVPPPDGEQRVTLPEDGRPFTVELRDKPRNEGKVTYTVEVEARPGELVADNNSRSHTLNVVQDKIRVLFAEGQNLPRWEYRFLKHALMRDNTLEVSTLLAEPTETWFYDGNYKIEGYPANDREFMSYDVIVLGDVDPQIFTEQQLKDTVKFVSEGGGFMMIAGERYAPLAYLKTPLAPLVPVEVDLGDEELLSMGRTLVTAFKPDVTPEGWQSPVLRLENEDHANRALWMKPPEEGGLPPLFWSFPVRRALPTATVLLRHPASKHRDEKQNRPLLVGNRYGRGLTMFLGSDELWRWRFARGDRYVYRFYAQAIQHLSSGRGGKTRLSSLNADRPAYSLGEPVKLVAEIKQLKGDSTVPLEAEAVTASCRVEGLGDVPDVELRRVPGSPGTFEGRLQPKARGKYRLSLKSYDPTEEKGGECDFEVRLPQLETEDPRMDEEALRDMVAAGGPGGTFLFLNEFGRLPALITEPEHENKIENEIRLWDNWRLFALFCLLVVTEWVLRKRVRMM